MKKVLFVLNFYKEQKSPVGICVNHVMNFMKGEVQCEVLSVEENDYIDTEKEHFLEWNNRTSFLGPFSYPVRNPLRARALYKRLRALYEQENYDVVIAVSNPPEAIDAVAKLKEEQNDFQFIIYEIDSASNRYKHPKTLMQKYLMLKAYLWEKKVYGLADTVIHMATHKRHYADEMFDAFSNKTIFLDIPGLAGVNDHFQLSRKKGSFIYAGSFYPKLREPGYMLRCLCSYLNKYPGQGMVIYSSSMTDVIGKILEEYNPVMVRCLSPISQEDLDEEMHNYDVLVSVGNKDSDFLPSKVLNYLALNKKIIHFYSDDNDVSIPYLKKSQNCLLIREGTCLEEAVASIYSFVEKPLRRYSSEELYKLYVENTPQYTAKKFVDLITNVKELAE